MSWNAPREQKAGDSSKLTTKLRRQRTKMTRKEVRAATKTRALAEAIAAAIVAALRPAGAATVIAHGQVVFGDV